MSHLRNLPTSWTKLVTCGKYLKGYDRPSRTSFAKFSNGLFQVQPNYKIMKRMWNALFRRKIVFRFSLQQFETDDGCFFKRRNRVSNLTAQKNFCTIWILVGLQNFWGNFHILGCYKAMDQQAAGPVEPI